MSKTGKSDKQKLQIIKKDTTISVVTYADVAELVDALASGASRSNPVEVQILSSAPRFWRLLLANIYVNIFSIA